MRGFCTPAFAMSFPRRTHEWADDVKVPENCGIGDFPCCACSLIARVSTFRFWKSKCYCKRREIPVILRVYRTSPVNSMAHWVTVTTRYNEVIRRAYVPSTISLRLLENKVCDVFSARRLLFILLVILDYLTFYRTEELTFCLWL